MECDYCHRNEDELRKLFSPLLEYMDKKVHLSKEETDEIINKIDGIYGFSLSTPDKLFKMDKLLLNMPIRLVFGDSGSYFIGEYPILKYIKKYFYDKATTKLSMGCQLKELLELYSQEPSKELIELEINKQTDTYVKMMKDIEEKIAVFYKVNNPKKYLLNSLGLIKKQLKKSMIISR